MLLLQTCLWSCKVTQDRRTLVLLMHTWCSVNDMTRHCKVPYNIAGCVQRKIITWSQLWHRFTPGFENYLDSGVDAGWYDCDNTLQRCVIHFLYATMVLKDGCSLIFRWVFIPWLQRELDGYKYHINNTAKRHDHNKVDKVLIPVFPHSRWHGLLFTFKVLPHGVPNLIYDSPGDFGALDFKVCDTSPVIFICMC
jgi:hypothetical protein